MLVLDNEDNNNEDNDNEMTTKITKTRTKKTRQCTNHDAGVGRADVEEELLIGSRLL